MANKIKKERDLTIKQVKFIKGLKDGLPKGLSAIKAGYSIKSADGIAYQLLRKTRVKEALDRIGLTQDSLNSSLKLGIEAGLGVKATNSDSLRGLQLAYMLRGDLDKEVEENRSDTTTNILYINSLKGMSYTELLKKITTITKDIQELKKSSI